MTDYTTLNASRRPKQLVENRISFAGNESELSIYDTYLNAEKVQFQASELMYCGMISGKKIMHARGNSTTFLPHESFVLAPGEIIDIDFPEATTDNPTTCLTIEITRERVAKIAEKLYDTDEIHRTLTEPEPSQPYLHIHHTRETQLLIERMVTTFTENQPDRNILIDLEISELVVRMLRHQNRGLLLAHSKKEPDANGINAAIQFIEHQPEASLEIETLCRHACMSRSRLYTEFRKKLGISPGEFQKQKRMQKALELLKLNHSITRICFELGFRNLSHFSRLFSQYHGYSPREYLKSEAAQKT